MTFIIFVYYSIFIYIYLSIKRHYARHNYSIALIISHDDIINEDLEMTYEIKDFIISCFNYLSQMYEIYMTIENDVFKWILEIKDDNIIIATDPDQIIDIGFKFEKVKIHFATYV